MPGLRAADARARQAVALLVICTVLQRWDVLEACYSDEGILPVANWQAQVNNDALHKLLVVHAWSLGSTALEVGSACHYKFYE